jgi:hypothetical protein
LKHLNGEIKRCKQSFRSEFQKLDDLENSDLDVDKKNRSKMIDSTEPVTIWS